nr:disulfide bond formation protein B [Pontibaca salina]
MILIAAGGSAGMLLGAFAFQFIGGLAPCTMCVWQRWPHAAAIAIAALVMVIPGRLLPAAGALATLCTAAIGAYHTGIERGWWSGPSACSSGPISGLSADELMAQIMQAPLARCDEVPWELLGLSMASWNTLISLGLTLVWCVALVKTKPAH